MTGQFYGQIKLGIQLSSRPLLKQNTFQDQVRMNLSYLPQAALRFLSNIHISPPLCWIHFRENWANLKFTSPVPVMLDVLRSLRSLLKISRVHTDGNIFRLHYSLTVIILMTFCIIITTKQYVGEPIDCYRTDGIDRSIMNTYCWIHTTYSIPKAFNKKVGVDVSDRLRKISKIWFIISGALINEKKIYYPRFLIQVLIIPTIQASFNTINIINGFVSFYSSRLQLFTCPDTCGKFQQFRVKLVLYESQFTCKIWKY